MNWDAITGICKAAGLLKSAVAVRACESAVDRQFDHLHPELFLQISVYSVDPQLLTVRVVENQRFAAACHSIVLL